jgi:hypothetical protein
MRGRWVGAILNRPKNIFGALISFEEMQVLFLTHCRFKPTDIFSLPLSHTLSYNPLQ